MNLTDEIYARVQELIGEIDPKQSMMIHALCAGANGTIAAQISQDLDQTDWRDTLITAGSLLALASYLEMDEDHNVEQFTVGDVTVHRANAAAGAKTLRHQAQQVLAPCRMDGFSFRGV